MMMGTNIWQFTPMDLPGYGIAAAMFLTHYHGRGAGYWESIIDARQWAGREIMGGERVNFKESKGVAYYESVTGRLSPVPFPASLQGMAMPSAQTSWLQPEEIRKTEK